MRITAIHIYAIRLPLRIPFVVSYHSYNDMPSIIVKIETDEGLVGYGEGVADEHVTGETWESTFSILKHTLAPRLLGTNPLHIEALHERMDEAIYGAPTAKAAIDIACFDLMGKKLGQPIYQLIGGRFHDTFPITHVLSIGNPNEMAEEAMSVVKQGYRSLKVKVGTHVNEDVARIRAIRKRVGDAISIRVDVNQGWKNVSTTIKALDALETLGIDWLEQPVIADDIDAMSYIRTKTNIPLMIDEGLKNMHDMRQIIQKQAADKVNIKLMKCGGIYPAVKLVHQAELAGIECQIGSMIESSIASAAGFHVAFAKKIITSVELTGPLKFTKDVGNLRYELPYIRLTDKPGLGIDVNEQTLLELTAFSDVIR
ncbi:mandelate racemase/muconate lactonizing enzyme family protein [Anoxybacillus gonensis]|uniref:mandelate racemase/muconate lactonizing enzyme family protein n=1 Tax=Anoxybacillus gonensis TaxID=198467 RepID=UPI0002BEFE67|nr:dipeptide epimerase [Anoxybacillus gonensis]EMI11479.1 Mandelate racemase/muconate lactonizing enzyme family protein [Anoxybacillus gonensis]